jgi:hypothetical protein
MSGGNPRSTASWCFLLTALATLTTLSGCGVFGPSTSTPEQLALAVPPQIVYEPPPVSLPLAPPVEPLVTESGPPVAARRAARKPHVRPRHHVRAPEPASEPAAAPPPSAPPPIITIERMTHETARGLLDTKVQRPDGKIIGRAVDLVAGSDGKPRDMVVNLTGFMGVGDRKMNFPWASFHFTTGPKKEPITLTTVAAERPADKGSPAPAGNAPLTIALSDATVERNNGGKVGRVVDILVDGASRPRAVVLDTSNSASNHEEHNIAANWSALSFVEQGKALRLRMNMSDAQIAASPPYAADKPVLVVSPATGTDAAAVAAPSGTSASGKVLPPGAPASAPAAASTPRTASAPPARAPASSSRSTR